MIIMIWFSSAIAIMSTGPLLTNTSRTAGIGFLMLGIGMLFHTWWQRASYRRPEYAEFSRTPGPRPFQAIVTILFVIILVGYGINLIVNAGRIEICFGRGRICSASTKRLNANQYIDPHNSFAAPVYKFTFW